jgi:hypothetical protein
MEMDQQQHEPDEGSPIFLVPEIILEEKIFAFSGNLKNLSLTCKYFNDLISNSQKLMKSFELKIEGKSFNAEEISNYNQQDVSTILKSKRKYSWIGFHCIYSFDSKFSEIVQHFKNSITKIEFFLCRLAPLTLVETFTTAGRLEEFQLIFSNISWEDETECNVDFKKLGKLKSVWIMNDESYEDFDFLKFVPETEKLEIIADYFDDSLQDCLKQYLEKQTNLAKLFIEIREGNYSLFPEVSINLNLIELEIRAETENQRHLNNSIKNFVKNQAKTLKRLKIEGLNIDMNDIQNLLEPMEVLESLELEESRYHPPHRSSSLVAKNFTCPKMRKITLDYDGDFLLFDKFPNLEELEIGVFGQQHLILKAAQHCHKIKKLAFRPDEVGLSNAFFPELVELQIESDQIDESFLLKHEKLETFEFLWGFNEALLKVILEKLTNLKHLKFRLNETYEKEGKKYQRNCDANKQILRNIWPLLGNLKTLAVCGNGLEKHAIYQKFPMIPGLTIINFK